MLYLDENHNIYGYVLTKDQSITQFVYQREGSLVLKSIDNDLNISGKKFKVTSLDNWLPYDTMTLAEFISSNNGEVIK